MPNIPFILVFILLPLCGIFFALCSQDNEKTKGRNVLSVAFLTVLVNIAFIIFAFLSVSSEYGKMQLQESYLWLKNPKIVLSFGVDSFSLLLMLGIHLALLIGIWGVRKDYLFQKSRMIFTLLFLSLVNGFLAALDIISFFIFFEAMLIPLFMLIGMFGEIKRQAGLFRFMIYNLCGVLLLFSAVMILYNHNHGALMLNQISDVKMGQVKEIVIWSAIFLAFLSRIPIWPFHSWVSVVSSGIKNPLVFIVANLMPLSGIYSFIRFWPQSMPDTIIFIVTALEIISVISMLFIALIGLINKDIQYKIFSFMTVYYIFFLLGSFLPTDQVLLNVGFSLFAFMIIFSALEVLVSFQEEERTEKNLSAEGILCKMPRASAIFTFMVFAGLGLPLSAMFVNNFVLVSGLLVYNFNTAIVALAALVFVASAMVQELFMRRTKVEFSVDNEPMDISKLDSCFMWLIAIVLLLSLSDPLWFMRG